MRVPVYERQGGISPMPAPQFQPVMPAGDFGASAAGVVKQISDRALKLANDHEDARTLELFSKFKADSVDFHENPDKGIYHTRTGYLSQGVYAEADSWLRKKGEDYVSQLSSPRAKDNFRRMAGDFIIQQGEANSRFEAAQLKKYRTDAADAAIKNYLADIETHWDDQQYIDNVREAISQALELKHRGEGQEVFLHAGLDVDDKIAQARIRQAYIRDPLQAVALLADKNIKLKPDTRAKLTETLRTKTEIYDLYAIAQEYAKNYSLENASKAHEALLRVYGADKGTKAFNALYRLWSVQKTQETAQKQNIAQQQEETAKDFIIRFMDADPKNHPTEAETHNAMKNGTLNPNTGAAIIRGLRAEEAERKRLEVAQKELQRKKYELELDILAGRGTWADDNTLDVIAGRSDVSRSFYNEYRNRRERFFANQDKNRLQDNADRLTARLVHPDKFGRLEIADIQKEMDEGNISPDKAKSLISAVEARDKAEKAKAKGDADEERKQYEASLRIIVENGGRITRDKINDDLTNKRISDAFANFLYGKENSYDKEQQTLRKQAEKEQAKNDKKEHSENLYQKATQFASLYPAGNSGKGEEFIHSLNIPVEDKKELLQYYKSIISAQAQSATDFNNEVKLARQELISSMLVDLQMGRGFSRDEYLKMQAEGTLTPDEFSKFESILNEQLRASDKAKSEAMKDRAFIRAQSLFNQYGVDNLQAADDEIRKIPDRREQLQVRDYFNGFVSDARSSRTEQNRIKSERQRKKELELSATYWRNFKKVPDEEIDRLENSEGLSREQAQRARLLNQQLGRRDGVIDYLQKHTDFDSWGREKQESEIMRLLGSDEDTRKSNVVNMLAMAERGELTDAYIAWELAYGNISADDAERLKKYDKTFERRQKDIINQYAQQLVQDVRNLGIKDSTLRQKLLNDIRVEFSFATFDLDIHAPDFKQKVQEMYRSVFITNIEELAGKVYFYNWRGGLTPQGKRAASVSERVDNFAVQTTPIQIPFLTESGDMTRIDATGRVGDWSDNQVNSQSILPQTQQQIQPSEFNPRDYILESDYWQKITNPENYHYSQDVSVPVHDPYFSSAPVVPVQIPTPEVFPQSVQQKVFGRDNQNQSRGIVDLTKGILKDVAYHVTDGYYAARKAYRQGRSHFAIDLRAPVGSPVMASGDGLTFSVLRTGENSKAGKTVTLGITNSDGDNFEITYAHLDSIDVNVGDYVSSGDVVAKSGNTGNTTGPHLHISVKKNGKPVDPRKVDFGVPAQSSYQPQQQVITPPVVSSDNERQQVLNDILLGGMSDIFSDDIWGMSGDFGIPNWGGY